MNSLLFIPDNAIYCLNDFYTDNRLYDDSIYDDFTEDDLDPDRVLDFILLEIDYITVIGCLTMDL